jgi:curved DNA-binding protein
MEYKDYYKILGISRNASDKEIKQAYRRLARQHHPDRNPNDNRAEERFKEINEAHEVLTDPDKRRKYDLLGTNWQRWQRAGGNPQDFDFGQWFAGSGSQGMRTPHARYGDRFDGDSGEFSDFFQSIFGEAEAQPRMRWRQAQNRARRGQDYNQVVEITLEEAYSGTSCVLKVDGSRLQAKIPPGSRTGLKVRLAGKGGRGVGGAPAGDLLLDVQVAEHPVFERKGDDLYCEVAVDLYTAILGGEVWVPTLKDAVRLKIPPETQAGRSFRLKGQGMPLLRNPEQHGDLFARIRVTLPQQLSEEERNLFEELARHRRQRVG